MPNIDPVPVVFSKGSVKIGANNYENSLSTSSLVPTTPKAKFKGVGGGSSSVAGTPDWVANLTLAQDYATGASLANYLLDHVGETVVMDLYVVTGGPGYRVSIMLEPTQIGGDVDALLTASVSLDVSGQPALIAA